MPMLSGPTLASTAMRELQKDGVIQRVTKTATLCGKCSVERFLRKRSFTHLGFRGSFEP